MFIEIALNGLTYIVRFMHIIYPDKEIRIMRIILVHLNRKLISPSNSIRNTSKPEQTRSELREFDSTPHEIKEEVMDVTWKNEVTRAELKEYAGLSSVANILH